MEDYNDEVAPVGKMESFILKQVPNTPEINNTSLIALEKKIEEQGKEILELKKENEILKKQLNEAFQNIISIYNKLNKYSKLDNYLNKINQIHLNFLYNSLDDQLYKLEDSFKSLNHELIKSRSELGLINTGIKRQLKKNIGKCILKYKASVDGKNPNIFHLKCDNIFYPLFIIKTTNERRFGVFFCNNNKNNNNNIDNDNNLHNSYNNLNNLYYNYFTQRDNFSMTNNMSMDFMSFNNEKKNEIFNCKSKPDKFFAFSLNNTKIYFQNIKNIANTPCFSINFDPNRESYYGKEKKVNINTQIKEYILSGKEEFNILEFEVYEIII
jgi:hypothetical protein